nr:transposase, MuDR, MULE transposase domain protein [Tanacetum cinerariifolium]
MSVDWKIDISYKRAYGGRNIALKMMNGSHEDSFSQLLYYYYNLKLANEGTVTHIHIDADGRFEMLYVGFGFAMRPLIIIDGAHLKGNYSGTNLLAIRMDGNNQILPRATGVSQGETCKSWTWFLSRLKEQIRKPPNLCIISDRHAAIILTCSTVFNNLFHDFCDRHLMMNCNLKGKKHRRIFWKACKAYTMQAFDKVIFELHAYRPEAINKLEQEGIKKWSRAYCPSSRYNYMTSNIVESTNSLTRVVRRDPITMLVEYCRELLQRWPPLIVGRDTYPKRLGWMKRGYGMAEFIWIGLTMKQQSQWSLILIITYGQVVKEPVTREDRGVEDWQAVEGRLDSYTPYFDFLSQPDQGIQQSQQESSMNYHSLHLDDL